MDYDLVSKLPTWFTAKCAEGCQTHQVWRKMVFCPCTAGIEKVNGTMVEYSFLSLPPYRIVSWLLTPLK